MLQKIKNNLIVIVSAMLLGAPALVPATASAALIGGGNCNNNNIADNVAKGASTASGNSFGCGQSNVDNGSIASIARNIVTIFSIVVGAVAIIMIIYGGFRYITSGGSSERVGNAKNTLIYAIIGLIIVALAQLIVHFVLNQSNNIANGSSPT